MALTKRTDPELVVRFGNIVVIDLVSFQVEP